RDVGGRRRVERAGAAPALDLEGDGGLETAVGERVARRLGQPARKSEGRPLAALGESCQRGTARERQAEELRDLVERLPDGVVERLAEERGRGVPPHAVERRVALR